MIMESLRELSGFPLGCFRQMIERLDKKRLLIVVRPQNVGTSRRGCMPLLQPTLIQVRRSSNVILPWILVTEQ